MEVPQALASECNYFMEDQERFIGDFIDNEALSSFSFPEWGDEGSQASYNPNSNNLLSYAMAGKEEEEIVTENDSTCTLASHQQLLAEVEKLLKENELLRRALAAELESKRKSDAKTHKGPSKKKQKRTAENVGGLQWGMYAARPP